MTLFQLVNQLGITAIAASKPNTTGVVSGYNFYAQPEDSVPAFHIVVKDDVPSEVGLPAWYNAKRDYVATLRGSFVDIAPPIAAPTRFALVQGELVQPKTKKTKA